jgi:2-hydroxy-3-oxopropionate reductase
MVYKTPGRPMARNLMEAGYELVLYNRTRSKAEELARGGAEVAESPKEVARKSEVIFTMLPGPLEVEKIMTGEGGLLEETGEGSLIVDTSTSSPVLARELARIARERGVGVLDAPVSGGDVGAEEGTLSIVKACNQIVVALVIEAVSEALVLGSKAGADPEKIMEVLSGGLAGNKVMDVKWGKFLEHDFEPGGKVEFHHKDLGIALEVGREYGVPLPVTAVVCQLFEALMAKGQGEWDHSSLLTIIENLAQHERP